MAQPPALANPSYPIESVDQALRLFALLSAHPAMTLGDIGDQLRVAPATARDLVEMLRLHDFVEHDARGDAYRFGPALIELGLAVLRELNLPAHVRPFMREAARTIGESVELCVPLGDDALVVDALEPPRAVRIRGRVGTKLAATSAAAKVLLAARATEPGTPSPASPSADELTAIRAHGYALDLGVSDPEVAGVAATVSNPSGTIRAALAIAAPRERLGEDGAHAAGAALARLCARASADLDRRGPDDWTDRRPARSPVPSAH